MKQQVWWEHPDVLKVRDKAAKYGCKKGNLPVAVYWYQKYEEDKPGYMPTGLRRHQCESLQDCLSAAVIHFKRMQVET